MAGSTTRRRLAASGIALAVLALAVPAATLGDGTAAPGYRAENYVTGFPESQKNHWGPIGIAFDQSDHLYVGDSVDGNIYRFSSPGGAASPETRITPSPIPGLLAGLAVSRSGGLYAARYGAGDVVQLDSTTGRIIRTLAAVRCATGLAFDPVSGDLFVSQNQCGSTIWRISGIYSGSSSATPYAAAPGVDGMAFDQDGTLYAESDDHVLKIAGTASPTPGAVTAVTSMPQGDGLAFGAHATGGPPYLVANRNNGVVTRVDFNGLGSSRTDIFTGGSRGDFAAVDSHGCLYITQSNSIVRVRSADGTCSFEPSTPGVVFRPTTRAPTRPPKAGVCGHLRALKLRLRVLPGRRLRLTRIYIDSRRVRSVTGRTLRRPITLRNLPHKSFHLKVVKINTRGHLFVRRRFYPNCNRGANPTRTLTL